MALLPPCWCNDTCLSYTSFSNSITLPRLHFSFKFFTGNSTLCFLRPSSPSPTLLLRALENGKAEFVDSSRRRSILGDEQTEENSEPIISMDETLLRKVAASKDAEEALLIVSKHFGSSGGGIICREDCKSIVAAAFARKNWELALSILDAMRCSSFHYRIDSQDGNVNYGSLLNWKWSRPDINIYAMLVQGLAASLQVSQAIRIIKEIAYIGSHGGHEVTFGKVVKCPYCMVPVAVVPPEEGILLASCSKCRYQYELVSGDVVTIETEVISNGEIPIIERSLRSLLVNKKYVPSAIHSVMIRLPKGFTRKFRFSTESIDAPAQIGERVTVALAAPSNVRGIRQAINSSARAPGRRPEEPMYITNHVGGLELPLYHAPVKDGRSPAYGLSLAIPAIAVFAGGDAALGIFDSSLPRIVVSFLVSAFVLGTAFKSLVLPRLRQLPEKALDSIVIKQKLLAQYEYIQSRLDKLVESAKAEVWMLARMCYLENKIETIGEPSYNARKSRVQSARKNLDDFLVSRLKLIDGYAKLASMIEIELEMDNDVVAAEAIAEDENIAERIEHLIELEDLERHCRIQAQANDELEKILQSTPAVPD